MWGRCAPASVDAAAGRPGRRALRASLLRSWRVRLRLVGSGGDGSPGLWPGGRRAALPLLTLVPFAPQVGVMWLLSGCSSESTPDLAGLSVDRFLGVRLAVLIPQRSSPLHIHLMKAANRFTSPRQILVH